MHPADRVTSLGGLQLQRAAQVRLHLAAKCVHSLAARHLAQCVFLRVVHSDPAPLLTRVAVCNHLFGPPKVVCAMEPADRALNLSGLHPQRAAAILKEARNVSPALQFHTAATRLGTPQPAQAERSLSPPSEHFADTCDTSIRAIYANRAAGRIRPRFGDGSPSQPQGGVRRCLLLPERARGAVPSRFRPLAAERELSMSATVAPSPLHLYPLPLLGLSPL